MIDLNPYFQRKLGETLTIKTPMDDGMDYLTWSMSVIAVSESPNSVCLEVESRYNDPIYHGVVEVDLNGLKSVMTVKKAVVVCLENPSKAINAKKII